MTRRILELSVFGVSVALALIVAEIAVRIFLPQIGWGSEADPTLGWSSREYQALAPREPGVGIESRLLFLGDSFLAGGGIARKSERFPSVLRKRLGEGFSTRILASGGWGPDQELIAFLQKGRPWHPELVVLAFCATNDLANIFSNGRGERMRKPYFQLDADGELEFRDSDGAPRAIPREPFAPRVRFRSNLRSLLRLWLRPARTSEADDERWAAVPRAAEAQAVDPRYRLFPEYQNRTAEKAELLAEVARLESPLSWSPQEGVNHVSAFLHEDFALNTAQWALLEALLRELRREVNSMDARLVVCVLPVPFKAQDLRFITGSPFEHRFRTPAGPFTFRASEPRDRLREICDRLQIDLFDPTVDFLEILQERDLLESVWPDPNDIHFSGGGHEILAALLHDYLARTGFSLQR